MVRGDSLRHSVQGHRIPVLVSLRTQANRPCRHASCWHFATLRSRPVEGLAAFPDLSSLPESVHGISIVTPPQVTEQVVIEAARLGIHHVWMQPGAESKRAVELAQEAGMNVIWGGPCILVAMRFHEKD